MEALPGIWSLTPIGGMIGLVILAYWMLVSGRIITKSSHEREMRMANKRGDEWKETALERGKLITEQSAQITALVEATKTSSAFFASMTEKSRLGDTGVPDVS